MGALRRQYILTLASSGMILLCGLVSSVLSARLLGPEGRGELAIINLWPMALVYALGSLGLHQATTFFAAREPERRDALFTAVHLLGAVQTILFSVAGYYLLPLVLAGQRPEVISLSRLFLLFLPVGFGSLYLLHLLQGGFFLREFNIARVSVVAWYAGLLAVLYYRREASLEWIIKGQLAGYLLAWGLHFYFVRRTMRLRWRWDPGILRPLLGYGLRAQFSVAAYYLNLRLDQLVMSVLLPPVALGYYTVAAAVAQPLRVIPTSIGMVTLPAAAREDSAQAHRVISRSLGWGVMLLVAAAVPLLLLAPALVPFLFGSEFAPAVPACRILLLAAVPWGLNQVLYDSLRGLNRPQGPSYADGVGLAMIALLLAWLLPRYGFVGAALAFLGAHTASFFFLVWYIRRLGLSFRELLRSRGEGAEPASPVL